MAKDYRVTVDESLLASNNPKALEKKMREMGAEGWSLRHVTSITLPGDPISTSRIYLFWERDTSA